MLPSARLNLIMQYEDGSISDDDAIRLFQDLVDTGLAWELQGHYGRTAHAMLKAGVISNVNKLT